MAKYYLKSVSSPETGFIQVAYATKDNPIEMTLMEDAKEYDYSAAKSLRCRIGEVEIDSTLDPKSFDRSESQVGKLKIFIGSQPVVPVTHDIKLEIVDAEDRTLYFGKIRVRIENPGM